MSTDIQSVDAPANAAALIFNDGALARLEKFAAIMASGKATIPQHLRGSVGDCFAITMQAARWKMDPFAVGQKTHLVNGTLGYEAQLVIAVINNNAPITGRLKFEWFGDWSKVKNGKSDKFPDVGVTASATLIGDDTPTELSVSLAQAGVRNSPLWADDPRQQLAYLAAKRWARLYCPDVILGVYTPDELQADGGAEPKPMGQAARVAESVMDKLQALESETAIIPDISQVMESIDAITNRETRDAAKKLVQSLQGTPGYPEALRAYKAKVAALKSSANSETKPTTIDGETGEILTFDAEESRRLDAELAAMDR